MELGERFGKHSEPGALILLSGELGAGKTVLVKGIALGLGIEDPDSVTSPSFIIVNIYPARLTLYHVDLYRIEHPNEVDQLGLEDFLGGDGVAVVEWGEYLPRRYLPEEWMEIRLEMTGEEERRITLNGPRELLTSCLQNQS